MFPRSSGRFQQPSHCGCFAYVNHQKVILPQVQLKAHSSIVSHSSRTNLTQTFANPYKDAPIREVQYTFPLYDGVSVVQFDCKVGSRVITGVVKERQVARQAFKQAVDQGHTAALFEQSPQIGDVFHTRLGNVPPDGTVVIEITYLGELKHDLEKDGLRYTIPTYIAPRYGQLEAPKHVNKGTVEMSGGESISITVDIEMAEGSAIRSVESPSHPVSVAVGTTSQSSPHTLPSLALASASLSLQSAELDKDFVLQVVATNLGDPAAILETHPLIPHQRALMLTLVPKFNLPRQTPEMVFICDRSGSMAQKMPNLIAALQIFLKSMPLGVKFNICSFGSRCSFLWPRSRTYNQESLDEAVFHVQGFGSDFGGTEMYQPVSETFERRFKDLNLEVLLLTDGEIWDQKSLFDLVSSEVESSNGDIRVFTLGVGVGASHALIEGVARAGNGFAQTVSDNEKMDKKVVRMLKACLTPHVKDYILELKYGGTESTAKERHIGKADNDDGFEIIEKVMDSLNIDTSPDEEIASSGASSQGALKPVPPSETPMSLFDPQAAEENAAMSDTITDKYAHLPDVLPPRYLQAPFRIPSIFSFNRTTVYLLLSDSTPKQHPTSVILKGTCSHGPVQVEIAVTAERGKGTTVHQLAARRAIQELENGGGWLAHATESGGVLIKDKYPGLFEDMVEREAVRLGIQYQIANQWCSFVAVTRDENSNTCEEAMQFAAASSSVSTTISRNRVAAGRGRFTGRAGGLFAVGGSARKRRTAPGANDVSSSLFGGSGTTAANAHSQGRTFGAIPGGEGTSMSATLSSSRLNNRQVDVDLRGAIDARVDTITPCSESIEPQSHSRKVKRCGSGLFGSSFSSSSTDPPGPNTGSLLGADPVNPLSALIRLQAFDGRWKWTTDLGGKLGICANNVAPVLARMEDCEGKEDVLATLCVLHFLQTRCHEDREAWEMVAEKALEWAKGQTTQSLDSLQGFIDGLF